MRKDVGVRLVLRIIGPVESTGGEVDRDWFAKRHVMPGEALKQHHVRDATWSAFFCPIFLLEHVSWCFCLIWMIAGSFALIVASTRRDGPPVKMASYPDPFLQ